MRSDRWVEVSPSQFTHEAEGLNLVRELLPDAEPFRAWSNFEFRDNHGRWHEVDLLVLGRDTLYLVELKYYRGRLSGNDHTWRREGYPAEDSPLKLANRKARYFATVLKNALREHWRANGIQNLDVRDYIPFVQEAVFLHHPTFACELPKHCRQGLYGLEGHERTSGLPPLSDLLLAPAAHQPVSSRNSEMLAGLIRSTGLVPRRQREVGSYIIDDEPLDYGEGWQDWPAFHRVTTTDRYRIRFHLAGPDATRADEVALQRRIEREYRLLSRLHHDGLAAPTDIVKDELGIGLVYRHDERRARLDLWLADHVDQLTVSEQFDIVRQLAETVDYAHRHRVVHRSLAPSAVLMRERAGGAYEVVVANWDAAGSVPGTGLAGATSTGMPEDESPAPGWQLAEQDQLFEAPEGRWATDADKVRLDVFALGALAFYVLAGQVLPAQDYGALGDRLRRDSGLDLAAELPQVSAELREVVLAATNPRPSSRTPSVAAFLQALQVAEAPLGASTELADEDPLEARPGAQLGADGRFSYVRKLGSGSTAVGILVQDASAGDALRVLKVARGQDATERLEAEERVLGQLNHERIATLNYHTTVGSRFALVLQHAGDSTLAQELADKRGRLSLDLLERWGGDLLDALVALDESGITHRDIKPSNLGVHRANKKGTETHLVLFDFSMAGTGAKAINAGTPPYLDPFLGQHKRTTYDSAAERYGAAVVLYEMATGNLPQYGDDPEANPASVNDELTIPAGAFDPSLAEDLSAFFRAALARDPQRRHDTAEEMRRAWRGLFTRLGRYGADEDAQAAAATPETTLADAGLSARAVSVLNPEGVATVADLLGMDSARFNRVLSAETKSTGEEIRKRRTAWRKQFGEQLTGHSAKAKPDSEQDTLFTPVAAAEELARVAGRPRARTREQAARLILGLDSGFDAFASQQELAGAVGRSRPRGHQLIKELQQAWSNDERTRPLLDRLVEAMRRSLDSLGGVATVQTLSSEILGVMPDAPVHQAEQARRVAAGLLRLGLDRYHEHVIAEQEVALAKRRRGNRLVLLARDTALLDAAEAAAERANTLVDAAVRAGEPVVAQQRAARQVRERFAEAFRASADGAGPAHDQPPPLTDLRLLRLAAQTSQRVALSTRGELHPRNLAAATAVAMALSGVPQTTELTPKELTARVRARFPDLDPIPQRPDLDAVVEASGLGLTYLDSGRYGTANGQRPDTSGIPSRTPTVLPERTQESLGRGDHYARVLAQSVSSRSFLALGVPAAPTPALPQQAAELLRQHYGGTVLDVTGMLIDEMRATAQASNLPWDTVRAADAAAPGSRDARGLRALVDRALPVVTGRVDELVLDPARSNAEPSAGPNAEPSVEPVILTELSPLARYGQLHAVARWSDLAARRVRPVWLVLPQLPAMRGAVVDGKPVQLGSDGQFIELTADWLAMQKRNEERVNEVSSA